jgi:CheY-like chemotaxis protein
MGATMAAETIVIIDDDRSFTEAASLLLEDYGYVVHQALTGQSGLLQSLARRPDVIIVDVHLPDMDGLAVAREIKRSMPTRALIMISSDDSAANVGRCLAVNPDAFLPKALVHEELPNLIARTLDAGKRGR